MTENAHASSRQVHARVVVVEDDIELRDVILVPGLADHGFDVRGVASAEALHRHILGNACDLVVLDVGLPNEDGFSAAAHLRTSLIAASFASAPELQRKTRCAPWPLPVSAWPTCSPSGPASGKAILYG